MENLRKPDTLHTTKHLTAWFDQWLQVYELLPHMIHPKSVEEATQAGEEEEEGGGDEGADGTDGEAAEAAEGDAAAEEADDDVDPNDRRVRLKPAQVKEVRPLHGLSTVTGLVGFELDRGMYHADRGCRARRGQLSMCLPLAVRVASRSARPGPDGQPRPTCIS